MLLMMSFWFKRVIFLYEASMQYLVLLLLLSCSLSDKSEKTFNKMVKQGQCSQAANHIPGFEYKKIDHELLFYTGRTARVAVTGLAYTADAIVLITGGIILPLGVCSPALLIEIKGKSDGRLSELCLRTFGSEIIKSGVANYDSMGKYTWKEGADWECPNLEKPITYLTKMAQCHYDKGEKKTAKKQLDNLLKKEAFNGCVSMEQKERVQAKLLEYKGKQ